jgi:hypothetical protein
MSESVTRQVKGGRAAFFENPETDRLLAMLMRLLTEHWTLKERVLKLEALLTEHGVLSAEALEAFAPNAELDAAWDQESYALVQAVIEAGQNIETRNKK